MDRIELVEAEATEIQYKTLWHTKGSFDDIQLNRPQGFCIDLASSRIYVADTDNNRIMVFALDGHVIGPFLTSKSLKKPFDLVIGPDARIYISQINKETIDVFNKKGIWKTSIPKNFKDKGVKFAPGRMEFDHQGRFLVNDRSSGIVWFMTKKGKVIKKQYVPQKHKEIRLLTGLAVGPKGKIYVTSAQGLPVITIMDSEGKHIFSFGKHGALYEDSFSFPSSIVVDDKDRIWIVDAFRHIIKTFNPEGEYLFSIGAFGEKPGEFVYPVDIDFDKDGTLYVLEKGKGRLQALSVFDKRAE